MWGDRSGTVIRDTVLQPRKDGFILWDQQISQNEKIREQPNYTAVLNKPVVLSSYRLDGLDVGKSIWVCECVCVCVSVCVCEHTVPWVIVQSSGSVKLQSRHICTNTHCLVSILIPNYFFCCCPASISISSFTFLNVNFPCFHLSKSSFFVFFL